MANCKVIVVTSQKDGVIKTTITSPAHKKSILSTFLVQLIKLAKIQRDIR